MSNQISVLGNLRMAGAIIMDQNNTDFPPNPKQGMIVVKGLDLYAYLTVSGLESWYPLIRRPTGTANHVHTQAVPSLIWNINHNLNTTQYWFQIQDEHSQPIDPAEVIPVNNNTFQLRFTEAQAGVVLVVGTADIFIDATNIGDGTTTKLTYTPQQQLNFVSGNTNSIAITFDDITKSVIFDTTGVTQNLANNSAELLATQIGAGLNIDGSYVADTAANYINAATSLYKADQALDAALKAEVDTRVTAISSLGNAINTENSRAEAAENSLGSSITTESNTRTTAVNALTTAVNAAQSTANTAISNAASASSAVSAETTRAENVEATLTTAVSNAQTTANEGVTNAAAAQTTANAAETAIAGLATVAHSASYNDLVNTPTAVSHFTNDATYQTAADVTASIQAVVGAAPSALATLAAIDAQLTADETAATALTNTVANKASITYVDSNVASLTTSVNNATTNAATAQTTANTAVSNAATANAGVAAEISRATTAEGILTTGLSNANTAITAEATTRTGAISTLTTNLNNEITRAEGVEATHTTNLAAVTTTANAAEPTVNKSNLALDNNTTKFPTNNAVKVYVDAETTRAESVESTLTTSVSTAQTTANTAVANAATAQTQANLGVTNAATAQSAAIAAQTTANAAEPTVNKSTTQTLGTSDVLFPTQHAVKVYVDTATSTIATSSALTTETNRATTAEGLLVPKTTTVNGHALSANVTLTASDVGLGNVNNTSDVNKPVSTAQAAANAAVLASAEAYADSLVVNLWDDVGSFNASVNTFPTTGGSGASGAILKGNIWTISVIATSGPLAGIPVGSTVRALVNAPGQTASNWAVAEVGIGYVPANADGTNATGTWSVSITGNANTANTAGGLTGNTLSGDVHNTGNAITLATVNSNVGSFGSATQIPVLTINAKGQVTAVSNTAVNIVSALSGLTDVAESGLANGNVLQYNSTTSKWNNVTLAAAGIQPTITNGSITNASLTNSALTIGSTSVALGATVSTIAGLTLTAPNLGTPSSLTLTNASGLPYSGLTGTVPTWNQSTTGNAATATNVAASGITGTTLASNVTASSLTSVGTLTNLTVTNPIAGSVTGNAATVTTNANLTGVVTSSGNATSIAAGAISNAMVNGVTALANGVSAPGLLASAGNAVTAAGTTQATATALTNDYNTITTATAGQGVLLMGATAGKCMIVKNNTAVSIIVYPATGHSIDGAANNVGVSIPANAWVEFTGTSSNSWFSTLNAAINTSALIGSVSATVENNAYTLNNTLAYAVTNTLTSCGLAVAAGQRAIIRSIRVTNISASADTITAQINVNASGANTSIANALPVSAGGSVDLVFGQKTMSPSDILLFQSGSAANGLQVIVSYEINTNTNYVNAGYITTGSLGTAFTSTATNATIIESILLTNTQAGPYNFTVAWVNASNVVQAYLVYAYTAPANSSIEIIQNAFRLPTGHKIQAMLDQGTSAVYISGYNV